jgi:hypothetical protein
MGSNKIHVSARLTPVTENDWLRGLRNSTYDVARSRVFWLPDRHNVTLKSMPMALREGAGRGAWLTPIMAFAITSMHSDIERCASTRAASMISTWLIPPSGKQACMFYVAPA